MKKKPPLLTAKDLANIRTLIQQECLQSNKKTRKELVRLRKENAELRKNRVRPEVVKFLLGEGQLYGYSFGETHATLAPFWWRSELRKLFPE